MFHIVFEGPDGSGKSTMASMLAADLKRSKICVHRVHQPGCDKIGSQIRKVFKGEWGKPAPLSQFYLAVAEHYQFCDVLSHLRELDISEHDKLHVCIQDRHSGVSGFAYQVHGTGIDAGLWKSIYCSDDLRPLHTPDLIVLYLPQLATVLKRIKKRGEKRDHFEQTEFLKKVIHGYHLVPHHGPFNSDRYIIVTGEGSIQAEYRRLINELSERTRDGLLGRVIARLNTEYHYHIKPKRR
jgi:thymidylate kinase